MKQLEVQDIVANVEQVLKDAKVGKGTEPRMLTAYQVLHLLPAELRDRIIEERGMPGKGSGSSSSAATFVAHALKYVGCVPGEYLDVRGLRFQVGDDQEVEGGYELVKLYRVDPAKYGR